MSTTFIRARSAEQKSERRTHLLETARAMLERGMPLSELGLNELARSAGMAKANVYRYFESREAILLEVLWSEAGRHWARFEAELDGPGASPEPDLDALVTAFAHSFAGNDLLCRLTAAVPAVLEFNLSVEAIADFKHRMLWFFRTAGERLGQRCPRLSADAYAALMFDAVTLVVGLHPTVRMSPNAAAAVTDPALAFFRRDLADELARHLRALAAAALAGATR